MGFACTTSFISVYLSVTKENINPLNVILYFFSIMNDVIVTVSETYREVFVQTQTLFSHQTLKSCQENVYV